MTLKERLARYMRNNHGWIASGDIQRLVSEKTSYTPSNASRRLRELAEEGVLEVQIRRGHAWYKLKDNVPSLF
jgi:DNA-binding transcriptional ArsR family regulator